MWNIFEHVLRYFTNDNNLQAFNNISLSYVYLNQPVKIDELIKLAKQSN